MSTKVLFIGLDSLDPNVLNEMLQSGEVPALAALREKSKTWRLKNFRAFGAGAYWPAMATGLNPAHHGRYFWQHFRKDSYQLTKFKQDVDFKAYPIWKTLDDLGHKVASVDWPRGPFYDMNHGLLVGNWYAHDSTGDAWSRPVEAVEPILAKYGKDPFDGHVGMTSQKTAQDFIMIADQLIDRLKRKTQMTCEYLDKNDWDFFIQVFAEAHDIGHWVWHIRDSEHPLYDPQLAKEVDRDLLKDVYVALDEAVAKLIDHVGDDVDILMACGPGMRQLETGNMILEEIAKRLDLGIATESEELKIDKYSGLYQKLVPGFVRKLIYPLSAKTRQTVESNALAQRRFFAVPHNHNAGAIRFNVIGREAHGRVAPGAEYEALCEQLKADLMEVVIDGTGQKLVYDVIRPSDEIDGPYLDELPDLFVMWNRNIHISDVSSPKIGKVPFTDVPRTGDHHPFGEFWTTCQASSPHDDKELLRPDEAGQVMIANLQSLGIGDTEDAHQDKCA